MITKFDDKAYDRGQRAFAKGGTLRGMIEPILHREREERSPNAQHKSRDQQEAESAAEFSAVIGFLDAFMDHVRRMGRR